MRIDQPDEDDGRVDDVGTPDANEAPDTSGVASFCDSTDSGGALGPGHLAGADREPTVQAAAFGEYYARVDAVYRAYRRVHPPHRHRRGVTVTVPRMIYPEAFEIALTAAPGRRRRV